MFLYFILLIIFRNILKIFFINYDYHSLFRSFFCLFISCMSISISIYNWDKLIINPLDSNIFSIQINKLMFNYMLYDLIYFIYKKKYRIELIIHHILCLLIFYIFYNKNILTFCSINEIISAFNWINILIPKYNYICKILRFFSIIFVRSFIWIYTLAFLQNISKFISYLSHFFIFIFLILDIYWIFIIFKNNIFDKKKISKI